MEEISRIRTNEAFNARYLDEIERELTNRQNSITGLKNQIVAAEQRPPSYLPLLARFYYEGALREVKILGRINNDTLQCYDIGAGHVKNYKIDKIRYVITLLKDIPEGPHADVNTPAAFINRETRHPRWD